MTSPDRTPRWRKSSFSSQGGDCVEVKGDLNAVRDSKHPDGVLMADVRGLIRLIRAGELA